MDTVSLLADMGTRLHIRDGDLSTYVRLMNSGILIDV